MKKYIGIALAVMLVVAFSGMAFGQNKQEFRFRVNVQKYIEVNPNSPVIMFMAIPGHGSANVPGLSVHKGDYDALYANHPFTVSFVGDNPANDDLPILAMKEPGASTRYDRLQTIIRIRYFINLPQTTEPDWEGYSMKFLSDPEGATSNTWTGQNLTFNNYAHDGEVYMDVGLGAALPHKSPDFGNPNTWKQSADAGQYRCMVTATFMVQ